MESTGRGVYYEGSGRFFVRAAPRFLQGLGKYASTLPIAGICGTDIHIAHGGMDHRVRAPQVIGHEMSGRIAEIGQDVDGISVRRPGRRTLIPSASCPISAILPDISWPMTWGARTR